MNFLTILGVVDTIIGPDDVGPVRSTLRGMATGVATKDVLQGMGANKVVSDVAGTLVGMKIYDKSTKKP